MKRLLVVMMVAASLATQTAAFGAGRTPTVVWQSQKMRVTYTRNGPLSEPGTYLFRNRIGKKLKFVCLWSRTGDPYQPPFLVKWSSTLKPHQKRSYGDWGPPAYMECGAGPVWPTLPIFSSSSITPEFASDSVQAFIDTQCAPLAPSNCNSILTFVNRVHALITVTCSWATNGAPTGSFNSSLSPYSTGGSVAGSVLPDPGSMGCTTT